MDWKWLVIVALLVLLLRQRAAGTASLHNEETWRWTDWRGRERQITVNRNVRAD